MNRRDLLGRGARPGIGASAPSLFGVPGLAGPAPAPSQVRCAPW